MVERRGGRYLARTSGIQRLEGERKLPSLSSSLNGLPKQLPRNFIIAKSTGGIGGIVLPEPKTNFCS
jgi:hypothetical protein